MHKVWRQLALEGFPIARCTVEWLMREMGFQGVIRGKPVRTTISFTYVSTWAAFVYVAFVIATFARRVVGWRASRTAHASFVLDALEQALHNRKPVHKGGLVDHNERES